MYSCKLKIKSISDPTFVEQKRAEFSAAFRYIYKSGELISDKDYEKSICEKFNIKGVEYTSIVSQVKQFNKVTKTQNKEKQARIENINKRLEELKTQTELTKNDKREIFKLKRKRRLLVDSLTNKPVFGGRKNLQTISHLSNVINKSQGLVLDKKEQKELKNICKRLSKAKNTYQDNRTRMVYLLGEANQKGNRYFDFDLPNNQIIYKPNFGTKIYIELENHKNKKQELERIQSYVDNKLISVTVTFDCDNFIMSVEELNLHGYLIDEKSRSEEVSRVKALKLSKEEEKIEIKKVYQKYYRLRDEKMLVGKIRNRYIGIDLNPEYISYAVLDKLSDGSFKIIDKGCLDLTFLNHKLGKKSSHPDVIYQNNKREHELKQVLTTLFDIAEHYKCGYFVCEQLEFDNTKSDTDYKSKEANRKINNIWCRQLIVDFIKKNTNCAGLILKEINPCYTSFIGNIMWGFFDPICSAIEITRRGIFGFEGGFYPPLDVYHLHTVAVLADADVEEFKKEHRLTATWVGLYNFSKELRWRRRLEEDKSCRVVSYSTTRSRVKHIVY